MFQSAPARESGRYSIGVVATHVDYCFNPRPLVRAGDTRSAQDGKMAVEGFNPRPLVRAGDT